MADPYRYFRIEAGEILEQLQKGLLELESGAPVTEGVARLLRQAHTLKGAARVVKQKTIADLSHAIEDLLVPIRDAGALPEAGVISGALEHVDAMRAQLLGLSPAVATPAEMPGEAVALAPEEPLWTAKASAQDLDVLMDGIAELHSQLGAVRRSSVGLERARSLAEMLSDQLAARQLTKTGDVAAGKLRALAEELQAALGFGARELLASTEQAGRELGQVRDAAERLRLVPADLASGSLERTARDVAVALGKRVKFSARGGDVRLDAELLGLVQRALTQAVRNAVAHGIETPAERASASKPAEGEVEIRVIKRDRDVVFSCRDDGRGLDLEAIRRSVERRGVDPKAAAGMDTKGLVELLLRGGVSTARVVTGLSGRGIGLDLVRETAEKLGGSVALESKAGRGTTLTIAVPVSLSALSVLLVEATGQIVALPLDVVRGSSRLVVRDVARTAEGDSIVFDGKSVAYVQLSRLLERDESDHRVHDGRSVVLLEADAGLVALGVDRLLGVESIVVRALPDLVLMDRVISGASFDGDGKPRMVLSASGLVQAARRRGVSTRPTTRRSAPILVIDDSLTTRMLEQSILESAGYEVELATSGEEGMEKAKQRKFSLFLVDVEMPGMDGFTFIEQARNDPTLKDVPAILVTSRASPADLLRGLEVGARAHIEKKEFNQTDLLDRIRRLVS